MQQSGGQMGFAGKVENGESPNGAKIIHIQ